MSKNKNRILSKEVRNNLPVNLQIKIKDLNNAELQYIINDIILAYMSVNK